MGLIGSEGTGRREESKAGTTKRGRSGNRQEEEAGEQVRSWQEQKEYLCRGNTQELKRTHEPPGAASLYLSTCELSPSWRPSPSVPHRPSGPLCFLCPLASSPSNPSPSNTPPLSKEPKQTEIMPFPTLPTLWPVTHGPQSAHPPTSHTPPLSEEPKWTVTSRFAATPRPGTDAEPAVVGSYSEQVARYTSSSKYAEGKLWGRWGRRGGYNLMRHCTLPPVPSLLHTFPPTLGVSTWPLHQRAQEVPMISTPLPRQSPSHLTKAFDPCTRGPSIFPVPYPMQSPALHSRLSSGISIRPWPHRGICAPPRFPKSGPCPTWSKHLAPAPEVTRSSTNILHQVRPLPHVE